MKFDKKTFLKGLNDRLGLFQADTAERLGVGIREMQAALESGDGDKALRDLIIKAQSDPVAQAELAEIRINSIDNFVIAGSNALTFFDTINLDEGDSPYLQNTTRQQVPVKYVGQDGGIGTVQALKNQSQIQVPLFTLASDKYEYTVRDIYTGDVKTPALAQVDVAYDIRMQINALIWPLIRSAIGEFRLTGPKHLRTYNPHRSINTDNLPTTNLLTVDGTGPATGWRKECLDSIVAYCGAWGNDAFPEGPINPSVIYIPSKDVTGMTKQITLATFGNSAVEQIFENGFLVDYAGKRFILVGDSTLDPLAGRAYMKTSRPLGLFYTKTSMDDLIVTPNREQNKESISEVKVIANAVPEPWRVNVAAIQYRTAAQGH